MLEKRRLSRRPKEISDEKMVEILVYQKAKRQSRYNGLTKIIPPEEFNPFSQKKSNMPSPNRSPVLEVTMSLEESFGD
jgi:hypothetical protein